jgi:hypothetical protein
VHLVLVLACEELVSGRRKVVLWLELLAAVATLQLSDTNRCKLQYIVLNPGQLCGMGCHSTGSQSTSPFVAVFSVALVTPAA